MGNSHGSKPPSPVGVPRSNGRKPPKPPPHTARPSSCPLEMLKVPVVAVKLLFGWRPDGYRVADVPWPE